MREINLTKGLLNLKKSKIPFAEFQIKALILALGWLKNLKATSHLFVLRLVAIKCYDYLIASNSYI